MFRLAARWEQVDWEEFADPTGRAVEVLISPDAVRQPPLDGLIDVTRRLASDLQRETAVIAVLTGPRTLGALVGAAAGLPDLYAALARAHAEAGARMLLVGEDPCAPAESAEPSGMLGPLLNVARYFRLPVVVLDDHDGRIPTDWLQDPPEAHAVASDAALLFTDGEVPPNLPAERVRAWCDALA